MTSFCSVVSASGAGAKGRESTTWDMRLSICGIAADVYSTAAHRGIPRAVRNLHINLQLALHSCHERRSCVLTATEGSQPRGVRMARRKQRTGEHSGFDAAGAEPQATFVSA